ncbi:MAG: type IV toxin-antitoxin system AbiEi family antitoxin [Thermoleophilia bacterium]|nr:type IV toxin-antitoxin system AbiEi family antitoxin [Thermoleophilia bacterium]
MEFAPVASRARLRDAARLFVQRQAGGQGAVYMLAAAFISPTNQQILREAGVPFFDFAGNAWLVHDRFHIDRRGFANPSKESRPARDPFSDKASLVLRLLMSTREHMGIRQIAEEADLTAGYVSKVAQELERRGYLDRKREGIALRHATDLLQEWVYSYRKRRSTAGASYFVPARHAEELIGRLSHAQAAGSDNYVLTLHAGASLVDRYADFDTVDLYVRNLAFADAITAELGGRAVERGGNLSMRVPYYRVSAFFGKRQVGGLWVASDLQLYLDLYDYPVRGREQAEHLYNRWLQPLLEANDTL